LKVSGFSFIKNAIIYDYPVVEAITSILPICDEFVVAVGESTDDTLNIIKQIDPVKIKIVKTQWDETLREGGRVLALETDKAFANIAKDTDWAFYIQGDEVVHEKYLDTIYKAMQAHKDEKNIDGLLFKYLHFYGSYDYVGASVQWYKDEIRVIRNNPEIYSYQDAKGFRKGENKKLTVRAVDAYIYHYGWVKEPAAMQRKQENFHKYWHDDKWVDSHVIKANEFDYSRDIKELKLFTEMHPSVMKKRIQEKNWKFDYDISINRKTFKDKAKDLLRKYFGIDFSHKNYILQR